MLSTLRRCSLSFALVAGTASIASAQMTVAVKASGIPAKSKTSAWLDELRGHHLLFPVPGVSLEHLTNTFNEARDGKRVHHALDIPAPRGTPVLSTDSGKILKLHKSKAGGLMVYTAAADGRFIYYYAHLDHYRDGLVEGMPVGRGDTLGYVGTTGNAPANTPHLHFAILRSRNTKKWSKGTAINPYHIFVK